MGFAISQVRVHVSHGGYVLDDHYITVKIVNTQNKLYRRPAFGAFFLDLEREVLMGPDGELPLRPKSFAVLVYLVQNAQELVTKDELMDAVWTDTIVTDGALTQCIIDIRRALGDDDRTFVRTVPRRGFIFDHQICEADGDAQLEERDTERLPLNRPPSVWAWLGGAAAVIALVAGLHWLTRTEPAAVSLARTAIAVLPFDDMTAEGKLDYLADGIAEEILNKLAQVPHLEVVSRTSSFNVSDLYGDLSALGKRLNATHILEGSVRMENDQVRVTAQLIELDSGHHLWSSNFDAVMDHLIEVQEDIAGNIATHLRTELLPDQIENAVDVTTEDALAYDLFLRAKDLLRHARDEALVDQAIAQLDDALMRDPLFAEAEAAKCTAFRRKLNLSGNTDHLDTAMSACRRAMDIAPSLLEAQLALAEILMRTGQYPLAARQLEHSVAQYPASAPAHLALAQARFREKDPEQAEVHFKRALDLDRADERTWSAYAKFLSRTDRFEQARPLFERAIELSPSDSKYHVDLGAALFREGAFADAASVFEAAIPLDEAAGVALSNAGASYYLANNFERACRMIQTAAESQQEKYQMWGNLADCCRFVDYCEAPSTRYYEKALGLALKELQIKPNDAGLLARIGVFRVQTGDKSGGLADIARAWETDETAAVAMNAAQANAVIGNDEVARQWIDRALAKGYPAIFAYADPDLAPLSKQSIHQLSHEDS